MEKEGREGAHSYRKKALVMGKFMAEDAVNSLQTSRCSPELVSVQVDA
jgi:hypothetical protein